MKYGNIDGYKYSYEYIDADWSEAAVQYKIHGILNSIIKTSECEEHMLEYYVKEDILNYKNSL